MNVVLLPNIPAQPDPYMLGSEKNMAQVKLGHLKYVVDQINGILPTISGVQSVTGLNTNNTDPLNPIVQISVDGVTITGNGTPGNPLVSIGGSAPTYPANEIPFGDGSTAGGVTVANFTFTPTVNGGSFTVSGDDGVATSAGFSTDAVNGTIGWSCSNPTSALAINYDTGLDKFSFISLLDATGIYYAGAASAGLVAVTGLGIDILSDVYTLGNPNTSSLSINDTSSITLNCNGPSIIIDGTLSTIEFSTLGKVLFTNSIISIGGKDIDFSAANALGYWHNDGNGVISYTNPVLLGAYSIPATQVAYGDVATNPTSDAYFTRDTAANGYITNISSIDAGGQSQIILNTLGGNIVYIPTATPNITSSVTINDNVAALSIFDLNTSNNTGITTTLTETVVGNIALGNGTKMTINDTTMLFNLTNIPAHADDTAAGIAGLVTGDLYKTTESGSTYIKIVP